MAPRKAVATLSAMLDDVSDDDLARSDQEMMPTPDSQTENKRPAGRQGAHALVKTKGKVAAAAANARITKAKPTGRRTSAGSVVAATKAKGRKPVASVTKGRKALKELENVNDEGNMTEEVDEFDEDIMATAPNKRSKPAQGAVVAVKGTTQKSVAKHGAVSHKQSSRFVPETQPDPMLVDDSVMEIDEDVKHGVRGGSAAAVHKYAPLAPIPSSRQGRAGSRQPEALLGLRRRAGSASSTERGNDPTLRRKLGDMTKKLENLDMRYRQLKEAAGSEALTNFEKLRKITEQRARDQDEVIAALKNELAAQKSSMDELRTLRTQIAALDAENIRLNTEKKDLSASLQTSKNEAKAMSVKLAAARSSAQPDSKTPGSAIKSGHGRNNQSTVSSRSGDVQTMKLKEDLYSDLTGLLVRSVKPGEAEDTYDCIVTGRNGTLHFLLTVDHNPPEPTTPGVAATYEDTNFFYEPLLDERNDRDLISILPDYLCDEGIEFPRNQAALFFKKIVDCLNQRIQLVEEGEDDSEQ